MELKIGQINAQRSMAAAADLNRIIDEQGIDMLCIQEPYLFRGRVKGYNSKRIVYPKVDKPWVAVVINSDEIEIFNVSKVESEHTMCLGVQIGNVYFYVINVYYQFSLPVEKFIAEIKKVLSVIDSNKVIICMDANARSIVWFCKETDRRGRIMEEFIIANRLKVLNCSCETPTFSNSQWDSNIDVTLVAEGFKEFRFKWAVTGLSSVSDHNLITCCLKTSVSVERFKTSSAAYNIKAANWDKFEFAIGKKLSSEALANFRNMDLNTFLRRLNKIIAEACAEAVPRRKIMNKSVLWWNQELDGRRKEARCWKKQMTRARKFRLIKHIEEYAKRYKNARNKYVMDETLAPVFVAIGERFRTGERLDRNVYAWERLVGARIRSRSRNDETWLNMLTYPGFI